MKHENIAQASRGLYVMTGGIYRTRSGLRVGPLRPFRDEEDGAHTDAVGRSAWFFADGVGAYDKYGCILSGSPGISDMDCASVWEPIPLKLIAQIIGNPLAF
ncbi:MAG: hypothetical protein E5W01_08380 [Mesorhizobium sp.]|nr:MAG: hypothetical protein E5W01_08380 [Mesorhizobium sp.]